MYEKKRYARVDISFQELNDTLQRQLVLERGNGDVFHLSNDSEIVSIDVDTKSLRLVVIFADHENERVLEHAERNDVELVHHQRLCSGVMDDE